jgi:hypothetical protein
VKNIYLCGPVSGRPLKEARKHFEAVEEEIRRKSACRGAETGTVNPVRLCPPGLDWYGAMRFCIGELVRCDGIALLRGWQFSKGAAVELKLARDLRIPVVYAEPPPDYPGTEELFAAAPETRRYCRARPDGAKEALSNRYLDPYGFEYIENSQEE